jgi:hypothetical protein
MVNPAVGSKQRTAGRISSPATIHGMHIYAADVQATAESITLGAAR